MSGDAVTQIDLEALRRWIGRSERYVDTVTPRLVASLRATLEGVDCGLEPEERSVPHCIHWCLAPEVFPISALGCDGHGVRGGLLPPAPLSRRMWAGGEVVFAESVQLGDEVVRVSRIEDVRLKEGASGTLCFITLRHELSTARGLAVTERQDIVYRGLSAGGASAGHKSVKRPEPRWERRITCGPVRLFRYSALTFNSHRIHYDADYCRNQEQYPGLVVQGPLQASLLLEFAASIRQGQRPRSLTFRAVAPLFAGEVQLGATDSQGGLELYVSDANGRPTMIASASW
jgi:3-methylfumaryl-CoA hydratase